MRLADPASASSRPLCPPGPAARCFAQDRMVGAEPQDVDLWVAARVLSCAVFLLRWGGQDLGTSVPGLARQVSASA